MKLVMVTGSTSGLGFETALAMARSGHRLIICGRDPYKLDLSKTKLEIAVPGVEVIASQFDLANLASIHSAVTGLLEKVEVIDVLVNNAGIMAPPIRIETYDGFELQFGTNHLGHFALTSLLFPLLQKASNPRVVTVSSILARLGSINMRDLNSLRRYNPWTAYAQSKLANILFSFELGRRACLTGSNLISTCAHPGYSATNLTSNGPKLGMGSGPMLRAFESVFAQSAHDGAQSIIAAANFDVENGTCIGPGGFLELRGYPKRVKAPYKAYNLNTAEKLWLASETLTNVRFPV